MINYTDRLTLLMRDIVSRVPALSFIDMEASSSSRDSGVCTPTVHSRPATA